MYGFHVSKAKRKTTLDAIKEDVKDYKIKTVQIFVLNPRSSKSIKLGNLNEIKNFVEKNKLKLYVHSSYTTTSIWNDKVSTVKKNKSITLLIEQLLLCKKIGAKGLVVHLPKKSYIDIVSILRKYKNRINKTDIRLLLEHPTFKSDNDCSYEMPFQLNRLTVHINKIGLKKWGYTIDTAHLWSSITKDNRNKGFKIETYKGANKWLNSLDKSTRNKIKLLHLNGSHNLCSSNKDKHAIPIYGTSSVYIDNMWGSLTKSNITEIKESGLYRFIKFAKAKNIEIIIEMNAGTYNQLRSSLKVISKLLS